MAIGLRERAEDPQKRAERLNASAVFWLAAAIDDLREGRLDFAIDSTTSALEKLHTLREHLTGSRT